MIFGKELTAEELRETAHAVIATPGSLRMQSHLLCDLRVLRGEI